MFGNNSLEYDNNDVLEHSLSCCGVNQFKTEEEIENMKNAVDEEKNKIYDDTELSRYKIKDPTIKNKVKSIEYSNAIIYLLLSNFYDKSINIKVDIDDDDNEISVINSIKKYYTITNCEDNMVLCSDLYTKIKKPKKIIDIMLNKINIFKKKCTKGEYRMKYCYYGLKEIEYIE
jgi:hypothetical protein